MFLHFIVQRKGKVKSSTLEIHGGAPTTKREDTTTVDGDIYRLVTVIQDKIPDFRSQKYIT